MVGALQPGTEPEQKGADLEDVRRFWEAHPLYEGESRQAVGDREFFEDHEKMTLAEHSGQLDLIFTQDVRPGRRVLDVGCGIGFWVQQLSGPGIEFYACDLTETAVRLTAKRIKLFGLNAEVRVGNAEQLPFPDGFFDHINCQGVIHHTPNTAQCLREFERVLKPGGTACFSVYYKPLVLRSRLLFKIATTVLRPFIRLPGRGREALMSATDPGEIVRLYDGVDNPLGKSYTRAEVHALLPPTFQVVEETLFGFPRRVFPFPIPTGMHRWLSRKSGLMLATRCRKSV